VVFWGGHFLLLHIYNIFFTFAQAIFQEMIIAKNIKKKYESLEVLKGVDVFIPKGELITIVGKSGAGKSTLLHILGTLDAPDEGEVIINDVNVTKLKEKDLADFRNQHIGFVFQFHHLLPEFSALENVMMPAMIANGQKNEARAKELLDYLGLKDRIQHKPAQLSGGEAQRVAVARALMNNPLVVFADEPTGNLDSENSKEMHQLFLQLKRDLGQTFVIVTHNLELADLSDRCLTMMDGRML
jgi:lipoprotein-releasing system ATP-binding protein